MRTSLLSIHDLLKQELPPVFMARDALQVLGGMYSVPQKKLIQLEKQGLIIRLRRGVYSFADCQDRYIMAGILYSPSYISYETALSYYGLVPERVEVTSSVVSGRPLSFDTPYGSFEYRSQGTALYSSGMSLIYRGDISVLIASREKAVLDTLARHDLVTGELSDEAVFDYVVQGLRIDAVDLTALSMVKLKRLATHYRNHGPRKLVTHLVDLKKKVAAL